MSNILIETGINGGAVRLDTRFVYTTVFSPKEREIRVHFTIREAEILTLKFSSDNYYLAAAKLLVD